jgi:hypothetical protein
MKALLNLLCGRPAEDCCSERRAQISALIPAALAAVAGFGLPYLFARCLRWWVMGVF